MKNKIAFVFILCVVAFFSCAENKVEDKPQITKVIYSDNSTSITTSSDQDSKQFSTIFINADGKMSKKSYKADFHEAAVTWALEYKKQITPEVKVTEFTTSALDDKGDHSKRIVGLSALASNN